MLAEARLSVPARWRPLLEEEWSGKVVENGEWVWRGEGGEEGRGRMAMGWVVKGGPATTKESDLQ